MSHVDLIVNAAYLLIWMYLYRMVCCALVCMLQTRADEMSMSGSVLSTLRSIEYDY